MKALTLTQPWATLIAIGAKQIETRSWGTGHRGLLAIHAAKNLKPVGGAAGLGRVVNSPPFREDLAAAKVTELPIGVIVAVVDLQDCIPGDPAKSEELRNIFARRPNEERYGGYGPGRVAWLLENVVALERPVEARGAQGLFELREHVAESVREQVGDR